MSQLDRPGYLGVRSGNVSVPSPTAEYPRTAAGPGGGRRPPPGFRPGGYWLPPPPKRHPLRLLVALLVATLVFMVAIIVGRVVREATSTWYLSPPWAPSAASPPWALPGTSSGSVNLSALATRVEPALVDINTRLGYQNAEAAGTGIVISSSGEVLTNNHVISGATSIAVTDVGNGQTYPATVVGYDLRHDIAVLQLRGASGLPTASIGDSSRVAVGDEIAVIGNAGGVGGAPSIAMGTVSALDQTITASDATTGSTQQLAGLIQVVADVQPGDSGGPLVNTAGQVVGVNTAGSAGFRFSSTGGEGFAIPISDAISISKQIEAGIASSSIHIGPTGILGILVEEQPGPSERSGFGNWYGSAVSGAVVAGVMSGSPGAQSGLTAGDVIVSFDGAAVDSPTTLTTLLIRHHPGDQVRLGWIDLAGQQQNATVRLAAGPPD